LVVGAASSSEACVSEDSIEELESDRECAAILEYGEVAQKPGFRDAGDIGVRLPLSFNSVHNSATFKHRKSSRSTFKLMLDSFSVIVIVHGVCMPTYDSIMVICSLGRRRVERRRRFKQWGPFKGIVQRHFDRGERGTVLESNGKVRRW
jgi:hypothetical protein